MSDRECLRCGKPRSRHNWFAGWGALCHNGSGVFKADADVIARASTADLEAELAARKARP